MLNRLLSSNFALYLFSAFFFSFQIVFSIWDEYDGFVSHLVVGKASNIYLPNLYIFGFLHLNQVLGWLQGFFDDINVVGLFYVLTCTFCFHVILRTVQASSHTVLILVLPFAFYFVLTSSLTGLSFILCATSLIQINRILLNNCFSFSLLIRCVVYVGLFVVGCLIRQESGFGASLIVFVVSSILNFKGPRSIIIYSIPILVSTLLLVYAYQTLQTIPFLWNTEKALYSLADGRAGNFTLYQHLNSIDSMKLRSVEAFMINDELVITEAFIKKMYEAKTGAIVDADYLFNQISQSTEVIYYNIANNAFLVYLFLSILFFFFYKTKRGKTLFLIVGFLTALLLSLSFFIKLEKRHFSYILIVFSFIIVACDQNIKQVELNALSKKVYLFVLVLLSITLLSDYLLRKDMISSMDKVEGYLLNKSKDKTLILDGNTSDLFQSRSIQLRKYTETTTVLYYNMGEMNLIPEYKVRFDRFLKTNTSCLPCFFDAIASNDHVWYLSSPASVRFMRDYLRIIHAKDLEISYNELFFESKDMFNVDSLSIFKFTPLNVHETP